MSNKDLCWCDGELVSSHSISVQDTSYALGLGLFETIASYDGKMLDYDLHMQRLSSGLDTFELGTVDIDNIRAGAFNLLKHYQLTEGFARVRITVGSSVSITVSKEDIRPISVVVKTAIGRRNETSVLAGYKMTSYAENILELRAAKAGGADEALFLNTRGEVCEGATSNLWLIREGGLVTPPIASGCLPGITREVVLQLSKGLGLIVEEGCILPEDLRNADAMFLTSSLREVQAVSQMDSIDVSSETNDVFKKIRSAYKKRRISQLS